MTEISQADLKQFADALVEYVGAKTELESRSPLRPSWTVGNVLTGLMMLASVVAYVVTTNVNSANLERMFMQTSKVDRAELRLEIQQTEQKLSTEVQRVAMRLEAMKEQLEALKRNHDRDLDSR